MSTVYNNAEDKTANENQNPKNKVKFTRGEQCLFVHLLLTFGMVLLTAIIYFAHLWVVSHAGSEMFRVTPWRPVLLRPAVGAGLVLAGGRRACGALQLRRRWALAPAHCVAARARLSSELSPPRWTIRYEQHGGLYAESDIVSGIVHTRFNKDDFSNNIGLFEQANQISMEELKISDFTVTNGFLQRIGNNLSIIGWESDSKSTSQRTVIPMTIQRCRRELSPVTEVTPQEICVYSPNEIFMMEYGAVVMLGQEAVGLFSWGDKESPIPMVILNLGAYKQWIESLIK